MLVSWNGERAKHATHRNSRNSSKSLLQINHYRNHFSKLFLRRNLFHPTSDLDTPASNSGLIPATSTCVVARTVAISATASRSFNKKSEPPCSSSSYSALARHHQVCIFLLPAIACDFARHQGVLGSTFGSALPADPGPAAC